MAVPIPFFWYIGGVVTSFLVDRIRNWKCACKWSTYFVEWYAPRSKERLERAYHKRVPPSFRIRQYSRSSFSLPPLSFLTVTLTSGECHTRTVPTAGVRVDGHAKLGGHKEHSEDLTDTSETI